MSGMAPSIKICHTKHAELPTVVIPQDKRAAQSSFFQKNKNIWVKIPCSQWLNPWASPYVVLPPLQCSARPLLQPPSFACSIVGFSAFRFVFNNWKVALLGWNWEANRAIEEYPSQSDNIFYSQSKNIVKTHQTTSVFLVLIVKCTTTSHDIKHFTRQFLQLL